LTFSAPLTGAVASALTVKLAVGESRLARFVALTVYVPLPIPPPPNVTASRPPVCVPPRSEENV
jgi:hypothetical protein